MLELVLLEKIKYKILFPKYFLNLFLSYSYCTLFILPLYLLFLFIRKIIKTKVSWFFSRFSGFHVSLGLLLIAFNMVSEQSNNETLENNLGETQIETDPVTAAAVSRHRPSRSLLRAVGCPAVKPFRPSASSCAIYKLRTASLNRKSVKSV